MTLLRHALWLVGLRSDCGCRTSFCWCDEPCHRDPCPSRDHWLEVDDSEVPDEWDQAVSRDMAARWDQ